MPQVDRVLDTSHGSADGVGSDVLCLAFVASRALILASTGVDGVIRCWDLQDGTCVLRTALQGHSDSVEVLRADGSNLFSGSADGTVCIWDVSRLAVNHPVDCAQTVEVHGDYDPGCSTGAELLGVLQAHARGVADMAITRENESVNCAESDMEPSSSDIAKNTPNLAALNARGLMITCGKAEALVKIWNYTCVGINGSCGRLIMEVNSQGALFRCVACVQVPHQGPRFYAGTEGGDLVQFSYQPNGYGLPE